MAKNRLTWPQVANNFLLRLTSTGQLPFVALILLLAFLVYRTPPENIAQVWTLLPELLNKRSGLGYTLFAAAGGGWIVHSKVMRRRFDREMTRVSEVRNNLQQAHFNKKLRSTR
jgi:hypothetical protein